MPYPGSCCPRVARGRGTGGFQRHHWRDCRGCLEHHNPEHERARIGLASNRRGLVTAQDDLKNRQKGLPIAGAAQTSQWDSFFVQPARMHLFVKQICLPSQVSKMMVKQTALLNYVMKLKYYKE